MSIQLKSAAEIAKLREANLIVADVLDTLEAAAKPGHVDLGAERHRRQAAQAAQGRVGLPRLPRLPGRALHLGQRGGRPRHPAQGRGAQGRATSCPSTSAPSRTAGAATRPAPSRSARSAPAAQALMRRHPRVAGAGHRRLRPGQPPGRHRLGRAVARRGARATRSSASSWATASAARCTRSPHVPNYGEAGKGQPPVARAGGRHRADGQRRGARGRWSRTMGGRL